MSLLGLGLSFGLSLGLRQFDQRPTELG